MTMQPDLSRAIDRNGHLWLGRAVTIVGLGRSGLAAAVLLRQVGAEVTVTDARPAQALQEEIAKLAELGVNHIEVGGHTPASVEEAELVVASPGVPEETGPLAWARRRGIAVISEIELAFLFCPATVIAVTGTNGKSTAVTLIADIIKAAGRQAVACGNLGTPFSSVLSQLSPQSYAVVEVSSFQLLHCHQFRPTIGVLLNVGTNHLDRHHDQQAYFEAKARLFQAQQASDWALLNGKDACMELLSRRLASRCIWFGENRSNPRAFHLAGQTLDALAENLQAVLQVSRLLGIADVFSWQVIRSFRGLEHRLEAVETVSGVHFINDSKSTTPDSLLYALSRTPGNVVTIIGGRDKGMDFQALVEPLKKERVRGIVLIGASSRRLHALFNASAKVRQSKSLEEAVKTAASLAGPGATVLFSPACASFDMFRDFEDRGRAFKAVVQRLDDGVEASDIFFGFSHTLATPAL